MSAVFLLAPPHLSGAPRVSARTATLTIEIVLSMRQPRVRRPFIVESRGSSREGSSVAIPKRVPSSPQALPNGAVEAARPRFDPWAAVTAPPVPRAERRILPNIMAPPEPAAAEPDAETPVAEEAPRRVRRVKPKAAAPLPRPAPRPAAVGFRAAPPALAARPPELESAQAKSGPVKSVPARSEAARPEPARIPLREGRTGRAALPAGQRWKARLPRACW